VPCGRVVAARLWRHKLVRVMKRRQAVPAIPRLLQERTSPDEAKRLIALAALLLICVGALALVTGGEDCAFVGPTVYPSPTASPIHDGVVLTSGDKIVAVGKRGTVKIPKSARVIDCTGKTLLAGFWNTHVHFLDNAWLNAEKAPAEKLEKHMQEMLGQWGFTTVWDLGSDPNNSLALRRRVESGEIPGPRILLAGDLSLQPTSKPPTKAA
jgi:hypothetical protein